MPSRINNHSTALAPSKGILQQRNSWNALPVGGSDPHASRSEIERQAIRRTAQKWLEADKAGREYQKVELENELGWMIARSSPETLASLHKIFDRMLGHR